MATNKHAQIRYQVLDRCFCNPGRMYFLGDLLDACNQALMEYDPNATGIAKRQLFEDIKYMESDQGWSILLERHKYGRKVYYRYSDCGFSINSQPLNNAETNQLKEAILTLSRFKGMPQFGWVEELSAKLESGLGLTTGAQGVMQFEENPSLKGLSFISPVFQAIVHKRVLNIRYKGFKQKRSADILMHPYLLKEYNNRWFLFGWNNEYECITNLAIDRFLSLKETNITFRPNIDIDFTKYFDHAVGVSIDANRNVEKIRISVTADQWPYVESKPLHSSQRVVGDGVIELSVVVNFELEALLFSYGEALTVLAPQHLVERFRSKSEAMFRIYSDLCR